MSTVFEKIKPPTMLERLVVGGRGRYLFRKFKIFYTGLVMGEEWIKCRTYHVCHVIRLNQSSILKNMLQYYQLLLNRHDT